MNILGDNSSNSQDSNAENFDGLFKKVDGNFQDSDSDSESYNFSNNKRASYQKRISSLLKVEDKEPDKTKNIKKNCISAKKSRERKKMYIEVLEKKAQSLKQDIMAKKSKITENKDAIMNLLRTTNPEKASFVEQTLKQSKMLAAEIEKPEIDQSKLQLMINSYMYKLGFSGVLRKDLIQQLKAKWYQNAIDPNIILSGKQQQLKIILTEFRDCIKSLEEKNNEIQFLVRKLQEKLDNEEVVRFLIDPRFFKKKQDEKTFEKQLQNIKYQEQMSENQLD